MNDKTKKIIWFYAVMLVGIIAGFCIGYFGSWHYLSNQSERCMEAYQYCADSYNAIAWRVNNELYKMPSMNFSFKE